MKLLEEVDGEDVLREKQAENDAQYATHTTYKEGFAEEGGLNQEATTAEGAQHAYLLAAFYYRPGACDGERSYSQQEREAHHAQQHVTEQDARAAHRPDGIFQHRCFDAIVEEGRADCQRQCAFILAGRDFEVVSLLLGLCGIGLQLKGALRNVEAKVLAVTVVYHPDDGQFRSRMIGLETNDPD